MHAANVANDFGRDDRSDSGIKQVLHMARIVSGVVDRRVAGKA